LHPKQIMTQSRKIRNSCTPAERILGSQIRNRQVEGVKFRRQQAIGNYIVDFVSLEKKLIIELDGGQHSEDANLLNDESRTNWLNSQGFRVVRFWNNDIFNNLDGVILTIQKTLKYPHF